MKTKNKITVVLYVASLLALPCHAQDKDSGKDPYKKGGETEESSKPRTPKEIDPDEPVNLWTRYEVFSMSLESAASVWRQKLSGKELYAWVIAECKAERAKQEALVILSSRSGQMATSGAVEELMYFREYNSAKLPQTVGVALLPDAGEDAPPALPDTAKLRDAVSPGAMASLVTPATGADFQISNVGISVGVEASYIDGLKYVDLRIQPEHVMDTGRVSWGQGVSKIEMPVLEKQELATSITLRAGQPSFLGTMNRPPVSKVDPDSANRVWFAFVTVDLEQP